MARTAEVFGTGRFFSAFAGRQGAFDSRDARRRVDVVDGNSEGRFVVICIFADHLGQAELMGIFDAHGHADQALAVAGHEVHVFCRAVLGGADEVALRFSRSGSSVTMMTWPACNSSNASSIVLNLRFSVVKIKTSLKSVLSIVGGTQKPWR